MTLSWFTSVFPRISCTINCPPPHRISTDVRNVHNKNLLRRVSGEQREAVGVAGRGGGRTPLPDSSSLGPGSQTKV
eukprot:2678739-Rhodomonas_salina.1